MKSLAIGTGAMMFPDRQSLMRLNPSSVWLPCWPPEQVPMVCLGFPKWKRGFHAAPLKYSSPFPKFSIKADVIGPTRHIDKCSEGTTHCQLAPWELQHSMRQPHHGMTYLPETSQPHAFAFNAVATVKYISPAKIRNGPILCPWMAWTAEPLRSESVVQCLPMHYYSYQCLVQLNSSWHWG